jgi:hypothetical protein
MVGRRSLAALSSVEFDCNHHSRAASWLVPPWPWAALTYALIVVIGWPKEPPLIADSTAYRSLALGRFGDVPGSISGRFLHPMVARFVSWVTGLSIDDAFFLVGLIALAVLISIVAWIMKQTTGFGGLVLPLLLTPLLSEEMFGLYYCQDLFYAALLSCFFLALSKERSRLALCILFILCLTRESTIMLALVWAAVAWFESDCRVVAASIAIMIAGLFVSRTFASMGIPNVHHTNELVFLALKPPFDLLRTIFGIVLVPDEVKGMRGFTCTPVTTVHLPRILRYGFTKDFGICRPDLAIPLHTVTLWLSLFGVGPAVLWALFRSRGRHLFADGPQWLKLALIYGLLSFLIAPGVSFWLERDIGYGWPAFWLASPALLSMFPPCAGQIAVLLLLANFAASWIPYAVAAVPNHDSLFALAALVASVVAQAFTLWSLGSDCPTRATRMVAGRFTGAAAAENAVLSTARQNSEIAK